MKKFLMATALIVAMTSAAFADGKKSDVKMLNDLKTALKTVNESAWTTKDFFKKTTFSLNGKQASAFVDNETNDLIGFSMGIDESSLPEGGKESVAKKFQDWKMINPIMFLDANGNIRYFVQVVKNGKSLALNITPNGKAFIYAKFPK